MNANSSVYVFENSPKFFPALKNSLSPFGLTVKRGRILDQFSEAWCNPQDYPLLITTADKMTLRWLKNTGFLKSRNTHRAHLWLAIAETPEIGADLAAQNVDQMLILENNVSIGEIVRRSSEFFKDWQMKTEDHHFFEIAAGELGEMSVTSLIDRLAEQQFSGRIRIEKGRKNVFIHLKNGKIDGFLPLKKPDNQDLHQLFNLSDGRFWIEQETVEWDAVMGSKPDRQTLESKDVLIDMFYYLHRHFEDCGLADNFLEKASEESTFRSLLSELGVYMVVQPEKQEKLTIIGQIDANAVSLALSWLASLFEEIQQTPQLFEDFFSNLLEIRQFVANLPGMEPLSISESKMQQPIYVKE